MGTLKTTNIQTITGSGTLTLGTSGETLALGSGVTSNLMYPAFEAYRSSANQTISDNTYTKITLSSETFDTDNAFDSSTNYRFTPQTAGKYFFYGKTVMSTAAYNDLRDGIMKLYKNGSEVAQTMSFFLTYGNTTGGTFLSPSVNAIVDMNGSSDYVEIFARGNSIANTNVFLEQSIFGGYRIGT